MNQIARTILTNLRAKRSCKVGNTHLVISEDEVEALILLHNNPIIRYKYIGGRFIPYQINLCGWPGVTTKRRINDLLGGMARVFTKAGELYMVDTRFPDDKFSIPSSGWIDVTNHYNQLSLF